MRIHTLALFVLLAFTTVVQLTGCAQAQYAQTNMGQAIDNAVTQTFAWGEVYCGRGKVCAEVEVLRVDFENRDSGRVEVTLHNRTGVSVAVQIGLEILDESGARLDSTTFQDVALPARQEKVWEMPGIYKKGGKIRVILRQR
jgi:hypothetical protein